METNTLLENQTRENPLHILIVDDDRNEREGIRFLIEKKRLPLEIAEAPNGKQALSLIQERRFDILFTDVKMPYMDGLELSKAVCEQFPAIKIIIFSAYGEFEYAQKAMEARAVNYLLKPVEVDKFYSVLVGVIERCRSETLLLQTSQKHLLADRELQWIQLLSGKAPDTKLLAQSELDVVSNASMTLLHLEALSDYFARQEQKIEECAAHSVPCSYEYVNLYPNSSYLILFETPDSAALLTLGDALLSCAAESGEQLSILIVPQCFGLNGLAAAAGTIRKMRDQTVIWGASVQFVSEMVQPEQQGYLQIEERKAAAAAAIDNGDTTAILASLDALLTAMSQNGALSMIYMHHVFSDLLVRLNSGYNMHQLQLQMQHLAVCRTPQEILALFDGALHAKRSDMDTLQDSSRAVRKVIARIRSEYSTPLSLEDLAQGVGFAPSYLSYVFKRETGENLIKYLTDYRMQQAKELLDGHKYKVAQVAKLCGYENPSYFNRLFKNTFGITPTQYRERNHG